jgi:hypothetical protein
MKVQREREERSQEVTISTRMINQVVREEIEEDIGIRRKVGRSSEVDMRRIVKRRITHKTTTITTMKVK